MNDVGIPNTNTAHKYYIHFRLAFFYHRAKNTPFSIYTSVVGGGGGGNNEIILIIYVHDFFSFSNTSC